MIAIPQSAAPISAPAPIVAPDAIKPIPDQRYRLVCEDTHDSGAVQRRFVQTTELVFHREDGGWAVESTLIDLHAEPADDDAANRFLVGAAGLKGRPVRLHLDTTGHVISIDDEQALWAGMLAAIDAMADRRATQPLPLARDPAAYFRALPPEARTSIIAAATRAAVPPALPVGRRPVSLPGLTPDDAPLSGTETVTRDDGALRDVVHGFVDTAGRAQSLDRTHRIDAVTGLLIEAIETRTMRIGDRLRTSRRTVRLVRVP